MNYYGALGCCYRFEPSFGYTELPKENIMTEAIIGLIGVAIGGIIGVVSTCLQQRFAYKRWKSEAQIAYLKSERQRCQEAYNRIITLMGGETSLTAEAFALLTLNTPPEFDDKISTLQKEDSETNGQKLVELMQQHLHNLDEETKSLLS
jgi:hypothetical protein